MQSVEAKDWEDLNNADDHVFQKKKLWKNCEKGPEGKKNCWKKKSLMDRKMEEKLNKKTMLNSLNKKFITVQNFLLMTIICENMA